MNGKYIKLDMSGFGVVRKPTSFGAATQQLWIDVALLVVDRSYQRDITKTGRANVIKIAENFNWSCFSPVIVAPVEGGFYAIIDGQHRSLAAKLVGIDKVPCAVVIANVSEQASAFRSINGNLTRISPYQLFKAEVSSNEEAAREVANICNELGIKIVFNVASPEFLSTSAISSLKKVISANGGKRILRLVLRLLAQSVVRHKVKIIRRPAIQALAQLLTDRREYQEREEDLLQVFEKIDLEVMIEKTKMEHATKTGVKQADLLQARFLEVIEAQLRKRAA